MEIGNSGSSSKKDSKRNNCVALLRESGVELDVFDAKGAHRSYSVPSSKDERQKLCFSSHGLGNDTDGMLTPCFDENGEHGIPDEGCFCGEEAPHLHAHVHDPDVCGSDGESKNKCSNKKQKMVDISFLTKMTLLPVEEDKLQEKIPLLKCDQSKKIPDYGNCCSSQKKDSEINSNGHSHAHDHHSPGNCGSSQKKDAEIKSNGHSHAHDHHSPGNCGSSQKKDSEINSNGHSHSHDHHHSNDHHQSSKSFPFPINTKLPNLCNAEHLSKRMMEGGIDESSMRNGSSRMFQVRHEDHMDYLVRDNNTGDLHLEHPCDSCGNNDVHGKFKFVSERTWLDPNLPKRDDDEGQTNLSFFEVPEKSFHIFDILSPLFLTDIDRVTAIRNVPCCILAANKKPCSCSLNCFRSSKVNSTGCSSDKCCVKGCGSPETPAKLLATSESEITSQSQFYVKNICCASEVAPIRKIVEPLNGVHTVRVNPTLKLVYVSHDSEVITAVKIKAALDEQGFGAETKKDGGLRPSHQTKDIAETGRSKFFVSQICCSSEIPMIKSILEPTVGILDVSINVTTKVVYVTHKLNVITAVEIVGKLNDEAFGAHIQHDAGEDVKFENLSLTTKFVTSEIKIVAPMSNSNEIDTQFDAYSKQHVRHHTVNISSRVVTIEHNPYYLTGTSIKTMLDNNGFNCEIVVDGSADGLWALDLMKFDQHEKIEEHSSRMSIFVLLSLCSWVISMLSLIGGNWEHLKYVGLVSVAFGIPPIALKAYRTLRRFQFDSNCMMFFAVAGACGLQDYPEAAAVTCLFASSEWLESKATSRARNALSTIVTLKPDIANLINPLTTEIIVVPAGAVSVGSVVSVRTGDKIPCDGIVIEGQSTVDESSLTGESRPVKKKVNDEVSGGSMNNGSTQLLVKVTATVDNSAIARLIRLVEEAQVNRSKTEKLVDEFAKRYTPFVVLAALSMISFPWIVSTDEGEEWTLKGLMLIVVACPCALIISTPVTYVAGLAATAQRGIVIKGGAHLESLGLVKKIALDKTGTLTKGEFALLHLNIIGQNLSRKEVLEYLALVESVASHPLATALVCAAKNEDVSIPKHLTLKNHTMLEGEGVSADVNGSVVHVGNARLFKRLGLYDNLSSSVKNYVENWATTGGTVGFISVGNNNIVGAYCVTDAVRQESRGVVSSFKNLGVDVTMLTGDGEVAALAIGNQVGLSRENVKSQLLPIDKLQLIRKMKDENKTSTGYFSFKRKNLVLMCGDGVNDAPALAEADLGVAMGAGAALAMETSDITLMDSNLNKLLYSVKMGRRVSLVIKQNIIFSLVAKGVVVVLIFLNYGSLWLAIASDLGSMLIVTLNGMRLLPSKRKVRNMSFEMETKITVV